MLKNCRVLVTGAGSGVGQGIIKSLRKTEVPNTIIGADISAMNAGLYRTDESILIPKVEDPGALDLIIELLNQHKIDLVMVGSEFDLLFFSKHKDIIETATESLVFVAPSKTIEIADDKWATAEFLKDNNLPYAPAYLPESISDALTKAELWGYPIVLKARSGTSSRHVHIINSSAEMEDTYSSVPLPMLQKVIDMPSSELGSEYTCSIFKTIDGSMVGPFTARRTVRGGTSWHIEIDSYKRIFNTLTNIGKSLDFIGSLNIQLMLTNEGPIPFELNARFSGTTAVRAYFGFNEPEMAIISFFHKMEVKQPKVRKGVAMRYHEEVFIENTDSNELIVGVDKGSVIPWF
jgi:carbamoyl-phosphate synthase large subunit